MDLSIIIVNWNTKKLLEQCLESILNYGKNVNYEMIIIDNNSDDRSAEAIKEFSNSTNKQVKIILNNQNLGFAKAVNQGVKISQGEYILLLNPDTEIKENVLEKMIKFMDDHPDCGIVGGKILNPDGSLQLSVRRFPNFWSQFLILLKVHQFFRPRLIKNYFALDFDYTQTQEVDQIMGAFFMIRKKAIDQIGLFDENFFLWFEEVDFCKRAKKAGWKVIYYPEAEIVHRGAASFSQILSIKNQWQFNKSLLYYFKKHHSFLNYLLLLTVVPMSLFLALLTSFFPFLRRIGTISKN